MKTECFNTQEQILNYLGKKNDRNLIQRMIRGGKIYKEDGMYYLVIEEDDVSVLKERIKELEGKMKEKSDSDLKLISRSMGEKVLNEGEINKLKQENADLRDHLKFFYGMDLARKGAMDNVVKAYYDKNPNDGWENAVEKANKFMGFSENPCENDEIEYVKGIL